MVAQAGVIPGVAGWLGSAELHPYFVCDVFTAEPLQGNQLGVFTDGRPFDTGQMQRLAREMNFAETVFLLPPQDGGDVRLRIFTPAAELSFADVRVPVSNTIGEIGRGFQQQMVQFQAERLVTLYRQVGSIELALERTRRYLADRRADLTARLAGYGLQVTAWYGVRVFTDLAPGDAEPPADVEALLGCEERAARTDPYRQVAALLHLIARRPG